MNYSQVKSASVLNCTKYHYTILTDQVFWPSVQVGKSPKEVRVRPNKEHLLGPESESKAGECV